ncbi:hypothetical protein J6590_107229, partial [Homalodisca vitripennis]
VSVRIVVNVAARSPLRLKASSPLAPSCGSERRHSARQSSVHAWKAVMRGAPATSHALAHYIE